MNRWSTVCTLPCILGPNILPPRFVNSLVCSIVTFTLTFSPNKELCLRIPNVLISGFCKFWYLSISCNYNSVYVLRSGVRMISEALTQFVFTRKTMAGSQTAPYTLHSALHRGHTNLYWCGMFSRSCPL